MLYLAVKQIHENCANRLALAFPAVFADGFFLSKFPHRLPAARRFVDWPVNFKQLHKVKAFVVHKVEIGLKLAVVDHWR